MKTNASIAKSTDPAQPIQGISAQESGESITLSAEEITDRASTTTRVLTEIPERQEGTYYSRHWGINE
jgi:hypothetical protein